MEAGMCVVNDGGVIGRCPRRLARQTPTRHHRPKRKKQSPFTKKAVRIGPSFCPIADPELTVTVIPSRSFGRISANSRDDVTVSSFESHDSLRVVRDRLAVRKSRNGNLCVAVRSVPYYASNYTGWNFWMPTADPTIDYETPIHTHRWYDSNGHDRSPPKTAIWCLMEPPASFDPSKQQRRMMSSIECDWPMHTQRRYDSNGHDRSPPKTAIRRSASSNPSKQQRRMTSFRSSFDDGLCFGGGGRRRRRPGNDDDDSTATSSSTSMSIVRSGLTTTTPSATDEVRRKPPPSRAGDPLEDRRRAAGAEEEEEAEATSAVVVPTGSRERALRFAPPSPSTRSSERGGRRRRVVRRRRRSTTTRTRTTPFLLLPLLLLFSILCPSFLAVDAWSTRYKLRTENGPPRITFSEEDSHVDVPPFRLDLYETSGLLPDSTIESVRSVVETFLDKGLNETFSEENEYTGPPYEDVAVEVLDAMSVTTDPVRFLKVRSGRSEGRLRGGDSSWLEGRFQENLEDEVEDNRSFRSGGSSDDEDGREESNRREAKEEEETGAKRDGRRRRRINAATSIRRRRLADGTSLLLGVNVTFGTTPPASPSQTTKAVRSILSDFDLLLADLTALNDANLADLGTLEIKDVVPTTASPSTAPTTSPSGAPSSGPTAGPTSAPSVVPSEAPTEPPSVSPTEGPTGRPTTPPSKSPTVGPTESPTRAPIVGTRTPTTTPTLSPTSPTSTPSVEPTDAPTRAPSDAPSSATPSAAPTDNSTDGGQGRGGGGGTTDPPSDAPSATPSAAPTNSTDDDGGGGGGGGTGNNVNPITQISAAGSNESEMKDANKALIAVASLVSAAFAAVALFIARRKRSNRDKKQEVGDGSFDSGSFVTGIPSSRLDGGGGDAGGKPRGICYLDPCTSSDLESLDRSLESAPPRTPPSKTKARGWSLGTGFFGRGKATIKETNEDDGGDDDSSDADGGSSVALRSFALSDLAKDSSTSLSNSAAHSASTRQIRNTAAGGGERAMSMSTIPSCENGTDGPPTPRNDGGASKATDGLAAVAAASGAVAAASAGAVSRTPSPPPDSTTSSGSESTSVAAREACAYDRTVAVLRALSSPVTSKEDDGAIDGFSLSPTGWVQSGSGSRTQDESDDEERRRNRGGDLRAPGSAPSQEGEEVIYDDADETPLKRNTAIAAVAAVGSASKLSPERFDSDDDMPDDMPYHWDPVRDNPGGIVVGGGAVNATSAAFGTASATAAASPRSVSTSSHQAREFIGVGCSEPSPSPRGNVGAGGIVGSSPRGMAVSSMGAASSTDDEGGLFFGDGQGEGGGGGSPGTLPQDGSFPTFANGSSPPDSYVSAGGGSGPPVIANVALATAGRRNSHHHLNHPLAYQRSTSNCDASSSAADTSAYHSASSGLSGGLHPLDWSNKSSYYAGRDTEDDSTLSEEGGPGHHHLHQHHHHLHHTQHRAIVTDGGDGRGPVWEGPDDRRRRATALGLLSPMSDYYSTDALGGVTPRTDATPATLTDDDTGDRSLGGLSTDDGGSSQASASRQFINDLVWLEKKIADVRSASAREGGGGTTTTTAAGPPSSTAFPTSSTTTAATGVAAETTPSGLAMSSDSLSYVELVSPSSQDDTTVSADALGETSASVAAGTTMSPIMQSIVCRDCFAPPGKLHIVIHSTKDGPSVHEVRSGSALEGHLFPGDLIIAVDNVDTRSYSAEHVMKMLASKGEFERKITVLHFEDKK